MRSRKEAAPGGHAQTLCRHEIGAWQSPGCATGLARSMGPEPSPGPETADLSSFFRYHGRALITNVAWMTVEPGNV